MMADRIIRTETEYIDTPPCKTPDEMEEICCKSHPGLACCEKVEPWSGYTEEEALEKLGIPLDENGLDQNGHKVIIEWVPRKHPCGYLETRYDLSQKNCCVEIPSLSWDRDNSVDIMSPESSGIVTVSKGLGPYKWTILGSGLWFDRSYRKRVIYTSAPAVVVYADADFCGASRIEVEDVCSKTEGAIKSTEGKWIYVFDSTGAFTGIPPNDENSTQPQAFIGSPEGVDPSVRSSTGGGGTYFAEYIREYYVKQWFHYISQQTYRDNVDDDCVAAKAEWEAAYGSPEQLVEGMYHSANDELELFLNPNAHLYTADGNVDDNQRLHAPYGYYTLDYCALDLNHFSGNYQVWGTTWTVTYPNEDEPYGYMQIQEWVCA